MTGGMELEFQTYIHTHMYCSKILFLSNPTIGDYIINNIFSIILLTRNLISLSEDLLPLLW